MLDTVLATLPPLGMIEIYGQHVETMDIAIVLLLVVLEGLLSLDNALVLGLLARRLPKHLQKRALTYGLVGAFLFRFIAIAVAASLLRWHMVKLIGGAYLIYVSAKHFFFEAKVATPETIAMSPDGEPMLLHQTNGTEPSDREIRTEIHAHSHAPLAPTPNFPGFWSTVAVIEMTDIAFAVDSIVAALGVVKTPPDHDPAALHPKLWVIFIGGFLGVILMRFAAIVFIRLLERFPRFETAAYLLVIAIGAKLVLDWYFNVPGQDPRLDFHNFAGWPFWVFWALMAGCFCLGFLPKPPHQHQAYPLPQHK